jgi:mannose-6-phosphate isomerase-like protein (cupin superfamily)
VGRRAAPDALSACSPLHTSPVDGIVALGPDGGERVERSERHHRILGELPQFEIVELRFSPDFEGVDTHAHADFVDSFYVLAGEAEFQVGNDVFRAGPGSFVAAPPGVSHGFRNAGTSELRMLNIHAPNVGFAERLRRG